jgi:transposase
LIGKYNCRRTSVCRLYNRSDRMVRLWINRFNEGGIDALASRPRPGRTRKVKLRQLDDLLVPVLEDPAKAGEEHWTGVKPGAGLQHDDPRPA